MSGVGGSSLIGQEGLPAQQRNPGKNTNPTFGAGQEAFPTPLCAVGGEARLACRSVPPIISPLSHASRSLPLPRPRPRQPTRSP